MPPTILVIQHKETVTLLKGRRAPVTDITLLGKFNGWEVARATRDVDPDLSVVYMSVVAAYEWAAQRVAHNTSATVRARAAYNRGLPAR